MSKYLIIIYLILSALATLIIRQLFLKDSCQIFYTKGERLMQIKTETKRLAFIDLENLDLLKEILTLNNISKVGTDHASKHS